MTEQEYAEQRKRMSMARGILDAQHIVKQGIVALKDTHPDKFVPQEVLDVLKENILAKDAAPALTELLKARLNQLAKELADI